MELAVKYSYHPPDRPPIRGFHAMELAVKG